MTRAILFTFISLASLIGAVVFLVFSLISFPAKYEARVESFADPDPEEALLKKRKFCDRQFNKIDGVALLSLALSIACSFLDGMATSDGAVSVAVTIGLFFAIPCLFVLYVYFYKVNKKYDLQYKYVDRHSVTVYWLAVIPTVFLAPTVVINVNSLIYSLCFFKEFYDESYSFNRYQYRFVCSLGKLNYP